MSACQFVCCFPEYVLDRTIVLEEGHSHKVSGFKLASASEYFRTKLRGLRAEEVEAERRRDEAQGQDRRKRTKSLDEIDPGRLFVSYDDLSGLEYVLSFIHCQDDLSHPQLEICKNNILSILKAGSFLKVPSLQHHCFNYVKLTMNIFNCWDFLEISNEIMLHYKELCEFINEFLMENFIESSKQEKFLEISFEKLWEFIHSDTLNCKSEIELLEIINKWIEHDKSNRVKYSSNLLKCIRFSKLTLQALEKKLIIEFIQFNWSECSNFLTWCQMDSEEITKAENDFSPETIESIQYMKRSRLPREAIILVGGWEGNQDDPNFGPSRAIQIYNSRENSWKRLLNDNYALEEGHAYSGCVLFNNKLYVVGGYISTGPTQTLKVFDLVTNCWKLLSPMHEKRNYISVCSLDSCIYAIGGHNGRMRLNSVEKYDTINSHWVLVAPMKQVRSDAGSDSLNGKVYVCGGFDGHHFYASVEIYDPIVNQWTIASPMNNIRSGVSLIKLGIYMYAIGGNDGLQRLRTVERFDPDKNRWQVMPSMIRQRSNFCSTVLENEIYVMGGWSDESNSTIGLAEKWIPGINNEWISIQQLLMPASANCCSTVFGLNFIQNFLTQ